jgi:glucose-1-phosphatase
VKLIPVFDLGNVLVRVDFDPFFSFLSEKTGQSDQESFRPLLSSSLFYELEFGGISFSEFHRRLTKKFGFHCTEDELALAFNSIFPGPVEQMLELLEKLSERGPVFGLSNTNRIHLEYCRSHFPRLERMHLFASHEIGARKPYVGTYRLVAELIGVSNPAELVFFDDVASNVRGARSAGWEAHLFPPEGGADLVKTVLGLVDRAS